MRKIKFRAWDKTETRMIGWYDNAYPEESGNSSMLCEVPLRHIEASIYKYMQYAGIKDKNGVEIYEGDILYNRHRIVQNDGTLTSKLIADVQIINGCTHLVGKEWSDVDGDDIRMSNYKALLLSPELFEIVGNIYENKYLRDY